MSFRGTSGTGTARTPAQLGALVFGAVYVLIGIVGFFVTGFSDFAGITSDKLIIFEINPLHNIVHLVIGIAGLMLMRTPETARQYGWLLFVGYGAVFIYGLFVVNSNGGENFLSLNGSDNGLHIVTALVGLVIALAPDRRAVGTV